MTIAIKQKIINEVPEFNPTVSKSEWSSIYYSSMLCSHVDFKYVGINLRVYIFYMGDRKDEYSSTIEHHSDSYSIGNMYEIDGIKYEIEKIVHTTPLDYTIYLEERRAVPININELIENEKQKALVYIEKWKAEHSSLFSKMKLMWKYN